MNPTRRQVLRAGGLALALPFLEALVPPRALAAAEPSVAAKPRNRLVCVYFPHGVCNEQWYPAEAGADWKLTPSLAPLGAMRARCTLFTGLSHAANPDGGGHEGADAWLTGRRFDHASVSLDQVVAQAWNGSTRFTSLQLGHVNGTGSKSRSQTVSFNAAGVPLPAMNDPRAIFGRLFSADTPEAKRELATQLAAGKSVIDAVLEQTAALQGRLSGADRQRLDGYLDAVRAVEAQIQRDRLWIDRPKPTPPDSAALDLAASPKANRTQWLTVMYDLLALALESDSTRVVSFLTAGEGATSGGWPEHDIALHHGLQHHGGNAGSLAKLAQLDRIQVQLLTTRLLERLAKAKEGAESILDRTVVIYGSGMNNGTNALKNGTGVHGTRNLPLLVAGGERCGLKHGRHLRFDESRLPPLANVFVDVQRALGLPGERFADSTGTVPGWN